MGGDISLSSWRRGRHLTNETIKHHCSAVTCTGAQLTHCRHRHRTRGMHAKAAGSRSTAHLPHVCRVDPAHGVAIKAAACIDHRLDLVAARHILVDLEADVAGRLEGRRVCLSTVQMLRQSMTVSTPS
jgi:hypothetical protein